MNNGLLCHQAVMKLQPLLEVEAGSAGAPPVLQQLLEGVDLLEKPSVWIVVSRSTMLIASEPCYAVDLTAYQQHMSLHGLFSG